MGNYKIIDSMKFKCSCEIHRHDLYRKSHSKSEIIEMHKRNLAAKMAMEMPIGILNEVFNMHERETEFGIEIRGEIILKEKFDPIIPHKE